MYCKKGVPISGTAILISTYDANPHNRRETHPEHIRDKVHIGYGERTSEDWRLLYEKAFELLKNTTPGLASEMDILVKKIVPLGISKGIHNSASYESCIGHLYMSYPE
jgi:HEXXH motif-containing protein